MITNMEISICTNTFANCKNTIFFSSTLLSNRLKLSFQMNSVRILNQYQLFYRQLEIKLINLVKYFVFWEISWEWWESWKVTDWTLSHYNCRYWIYLPQQRSWHFLSRLINFSSKLSIHMTEWVVGNQYLQFSK